MDRTFKSKIECTSELRRLRSLLQQQELRPEVIPPELAESTKWVVWSYEIWEQNGVFRLDKQPYQAKNPNGDVSRVLSRTYLSELSDLDTAVSCLRENPYMDGIGYFFVEGDGLTGVDFDNCRDPITGEIQGEYLFWIEKIGSYTEVSPSGTGVKVWVKGKVPDNYFLSTVSTGFRIQNYAGGEIEVFRGGQYFTVTTQLLNGYDRIKVAQRELDVICEFSMSNTVWNFKYFPEQEHDLPLRKLDEQIELYLLQSYWSVLQSYWNDMGLKYEMDEQIELSLLQRYWDDMSLKYENESDI